jgi:hypothetical protein
MVEAKVISGLLENRRQIDATIALFATDITAARRKASRFARSEHFASGELTRRCCEGFRRFTEPIAAEDLAVTAVRDKGIDPIGCRDPG